MAQLNIRIDDESRDLVDSLARARGWSTSDLLRDLIWQALGRDRDGDPERPSEDLTPTSLSVVERRRLSLLHEVMACLVADDEYESAYHRQVVEVLNSGYTSQYYRTFQFMDRELTTRECDLVHDILDMFRTIKGSVNALDDDQRSSLGEHWESWLTYQGLDFNDSHESRLSSYAHFLIKDGRWAELADRFDDENEAGNSHSPMLATYQRMLSVWKPLWAEKIRAAPGRHRFTVAELQRIIAACPYPRG